jgi:hypothetical protein
MTLRLVPALIFALAASALATRIAQAEVYKWVDEKGKTNYSNTRPPSAAGKVQVVEEQISVSGPDPATQAAAERRLTYRESQAEREWQQRQQAMILQAATPSYGSDYYPETYYPAYFGYGYGNYGRPHLARRLISSSPRFPHAAPRAAFRSSHLTKR